MEWIKDKNGNRCSVEHFGSREAAQKALDSLEDCSGCSDCSDCSRCSDCSGCSRCSDCSGCSRCSDCSDCSRCSDCSDCSDCSGCSRCSGCYDCSRCYGCYGCSRCSDCSRCSRCSDCSRCYGCYDCSRCSGLEDSSPRANIDKVQVPKVENIHQQIYAAASAPKALEMDSFHTCKNTHCRAGWAITLAGKAGKKLEERFGSVLAAMKIYDASDPNYRINPCRFFDSNEAALADMKKLAETSAHAGTEVSE